MHTVIRNGLRRLAVVSAVFLIQFAGCSRVDVAQPGSERSRTEFGTSEPVRQNTAERIAEIEKELAAPLTGMPGEGDRRKTLKGELANLQATYGWQDRAKASLMYGQQVQQLQQQQMQQQQLNSQYGNRTKTQVRGPGER